MIAIRKRKHKGKDFEWWKQYVPLNRIVEVIPKEKKNVIYPDEEDILNRFKPSGACAYNYYK